jgi:hypothetical protein
VNVDPAMVSVPVRIAPVFAATVKLTDPAPVPLEPLVTVIQLASLTAVHAQPDCVVTVTGPPVPPAVSNAWLIGEMLYAHAALCEIVTVCPATVSVPVRAAPVFASTEKVTVPAPVPLAPVTIVIQLTLAVAVHEHPDDVVTEIGEPAPPAAPTDALGGATV